MTDETTQTRRARKNSSQDRESNQTTATSGNTSDNRQPVEPDRSLQRPAKKLAKRSEAERALKPSNPLEIPHGDVAQGSEEYKEWRQVQHRHGMKNLIRSLLIFGGLAILYWVFVHKI